MYSTTHTHSFSVKTFFFFRQLYTQFLSLLSCSSKVCVALIGTKIYNFVLKLLLLYHQHKITASYFAVSPETELLSKVPHSLPSRDKKYLTTMGTVFMSFLFEATIDIAKK
jgi:hypothetical protein